MAEMSPGTALRQLQQAQAGLKKTRRFLQQARESPSAAPAALDEGSESLIQSPLEKLKNSLDPAKPMTPRSLESPRKTKK
jgi:hypothetical protein